MKYRLYDYKGDSTNKRSNADYAYCPTAEAAADFRRDYTDEGYIISYDNNPVGWYHLNGDEGIWSKFRNGILLAMLAESHNPCVA